MSMSAENHETNRLIEGTEQNIKTSGCIGGEVEICKNAPFLQERLALFNKFYEEYQKSIQEKPHTDITITLPDGTQKPGKAWETTPMNIAEGISKGLAQHVLVARVVYDDASIGSCYVKTEEDDDHEEEEEGMLWDLTRPLEGSCKLWLLKFEDKGGKATFWHSSAHVLGESMENLYGVDLCIGPALKDGFYYDGYFGKMSVTEKDCSDIEAESNRIVKEKQVFQRCVLTKEQALELFAHNPFKKSIISSKVPDGGLTTVYRCGTLVDLCMGPHLPTTALIKGFAVVKNSACYWLGDAENDTLQRVYGISFPDAKELKEWKKFQEEAKKNDHRRLGEQQDLFFFHELSPGSCFFLPRGACVYNKLIEFIRGEYHKRGYTEVITPNVFNLDLWRISGHADHYKDDMFLFKCDDTEYGLKPMNCPGHCLMFKHSLHSYRELPLRFADFGVLHRNELSGALNGLTRVRRFQQDDAHIFCRPDQIKQEVSGVLDFMRHVYGIFGMTFKLELSTRPKKAMGDLALWDRAEASLKESLDDFIGAGNWKVNPGDGAFYGPKIDIKVMDAMNRMHQTATIQLDFQLPIRFDLSYKTETGAMERPVMVHRAILGSVERSFAILLEHYKGKWPFWLSPRQAIVIPVNATCMEYAQKVKQMLWDNNFLVDVDDSGRTLNKMVREAQLEQYNYILVVGNKEVEGGQVAIRSRSNEMVGVKTLEECVAMFKEMEVNHQ
ncbi:hypothetical protein WA556_004673 [Blastocystis sp. ATCC 50177/Nand II]